MMSNLGYAHPQQQYHMPSPQQQQQQQPQQPQQPQQQQPQQQQQQQQMMMPPMPTGGGAFPMPTTLMMSPQPQQQQPQQPQQQPQGAAQPTPQQQQQMMGLSSYGHGGGAPAHLLGAIGGIGGILGGGASGADNSFGALTSKPDFVHLQPPNAKPLEEAVDKQTRQRLQADYEAALQMTLLDDHSYLYTLLCKSKAMEAPQYLLHTLCSLYKLKYAALFEEHQSLHIWMVFCLGTVIYQSVRKFKDFCKKSSASPKTLSMLTPTMALMSRKRTRPPLVLASAGAGGFNALKKTARQSFEHISAGSLAAAGAGQHQQSEHQQQPSPQCAADAGADAPLSDLQLLQQKAQLKRQLAEAEKSALAHHPFLSESNVYSQKELLFNLGKCLQYCVPSDFGLLVMNASYANVKEFRKSATNNYTGVKVVFQKPIICSFNERVHSETEYYTLEYTDEIVRCLEAMTSFSSPYRSIDLGKRTQSWEIKIDSGIQADIKNFTYSNIAKSSVCCIVLGNLNALGKNNNTIQIKAFANEVYSLAYDILAIDSARLAECEALNASLQPRYDALMTTYEQTHNLFDLDDIEQLEIQQQQPPPPQSPPQSQSQEQRSPDSSRPTHAGGSPDGLSAEGDGGGVGGARDGHADGDGVPATAGAAATAGPGVRGDASSNSDEGDDRYDEDDD